MEYKYRIVVADDHNMFRAGLKGLIDREPSMSVVGEAENGQELLAKLRSVKCDLVILDIAMPQMGGMTAMSTIVSKYPKVKILILTMYKDPEHFKYAMSHGASGYLLKDDAFEQLVLAIKVIMKGKQFVSPTVSSQLTDRFVRSADDPDLPSIEILTSREKEILKLITTGLANKNIAKKFNISVRTVETHRSNLTNKLGIKSTAGLVKYAMMKGIV